MGFDNNKVISEVFCPLVNKMIEDIDCIENRDCIDGYVKLASLPGEYKVRQNYIDICKMCKWHSY